MRDVRVPFQQGKLLVGAGADVRGERMIVLPEFGGGAVFHQAACLKWLNATVFLVVQSAGNRFIETACGKVGLNAGIDGLRAILVEP